MIYNAVLAIFCLASILLSLFYIYIIWRYISGWEDIKLFKTPPDYSPVTFVSILIPARNEEDNIEKCLKSVLQQNYPATLFEVIVIDDDSEDETVQIVENINDQKVKLFHTADFVNSDGSLSSKKKAVELGISKAKGKLIITTDADCITPENWLKTIVSFYEVKQPKFIAAPVNYYDEKNLFERFQSLDYLGMMGVTGGGIQGKIMNMCNGANLAYEKEIFEAVNGFEGIDQLASGDDMLLMQKIAQHYPNGIGFIKNQNAVVITKAQPNLNSFLNQRIRWASKTTSYKEWKVILISILVFLFCFTIILSFILIPFFGFAFALIFLLLLIIKMVTDYYFLSKMTKFFNRRDLMKSFLPAQFLHIAYIVGVGFLSVFIRKYYWKGRKTS